MVNVIEQGDIYFLYRPRVVSADAQPKPRSAGDVQRFFMVLSPHGKNIYRLMIMGRKRLPERQGAGEKFWGFVDRVEHDPKDLREDLEGSSYETQTRGERKIPAARAAGEGVYGLIRHDRHAHFAYVLELPQKPGEVQEEFHIAGEGSYIISVKNPRHGAPFGIGLRHRQKAELPKELLARFEGKRFTDPDPPDLLDHAGVEFILIGAEENVREDLGVELQPESESMETAEIFRDLRLRKTKNPVTPLFQGTWV